MDYKLEAKIVETMKKPLSKKTDDDYFWLLDKREELIKERVKVMSTFPQAIGNHIVVDASVQSGYTLSGKLTIYKVDEDRAVSTSIYSDEDLAELIKALQAIQEARKLHDFQREIRLLVSDMTVRKWREARKTQH